MTSHILIIDDRINLPRFIAMELRAEGYQVSINDENANELSLMRNFDPDLIILNWDLRRTSGINLYQRLRLADSRVPIVILTAKDKSSCHLALELGAQTCLTKPFSMNDLLKAIDYHLKFQKQSEKYLVCD